MNAGPAPARNRAAHAATAAAARREDGPPVRRQGDPAALSRRLRAETRADHAGVDAAYGRFDLADRAGYAAFLGAQARVLPPLESLLRPADLLPGWHGRAAPLAADLAALGIAMPPPLALPTALAITLSGGEAARWGAVYVLEGSRLGGAVLAATVPPGLPRAFLGAVHPPAAWRNLLLALDRIDPRDHPAALASARAVFALFAAAAG
jgi:heme oxygenase